MPALLFPLGLAALLAVVVPLVIHLMRRDELRPVAFAALRWLDPRPKPRQRIRFSEWPLLIVRLLLIAVLAVVLARPVLTAPMSAKPFVAVAPGVDLAAVREGDDEVQRHWLAPGFPSTDRPAPQTTASVSSLLRELDAQLPQGVKLTVVVPQTLQGVDAERPVLSRPVDWRIVAGAMPAPQAMTTKRPVLSVRHTPERAADVRWFRAVSAAWLTPFEAAATDAALPPKDRVVVWLGAGDAPQSVRDWARSGGTVLFGSQMVWPQSPNRRIAWRDETGAPLMEAQSEGKGRMLRLTRALNAAAFPILIESEFPEKLNNILSDQVTPARVASRDLIPVTGRSVFTRPAEDLTPWLALLAAALFLIERILATASRRRAAP
ncbi:BatA domain-containing protein [Asticcacaulis sp. AND118]|uniref:BatA domain-containing protein n=1 Tax=Asticcacaulis sp. AND118 TaxID=2840468 RepID=UPI001CFF9B8E|nr:BatA domain-containing protein [Asticcacaulis sp. AND118]UDF03944.1 BatA domain-containing protein [Asticcacaulis sp. AND118]